MLHRTVPEALATAESRSIIALLRRNIEYVRRVEGVREKLNQSFTHIIIYLSKIAAMNNKLTIIAQKSSVQVASRFRLSRSVSMGK